VSLDSRELVTMLGQVTRERFGEFWGQRFTALESFCCQPEGGCLETGSAGRHARNLAQWTYRGIEWEIVLEKYAARRGTHVR
jgi:hypothetical protein